MSSGTRKDEKVQKKTFGKWINAQLSSRGIVITDLYYDLRDGHVLLELLEVLTNQTYVKEKGKLRVHHLGNAYTILSILKENKVKLVNINNVDLVDGNPKITLALVWSIIVHWQFKDVMRESLVKGSSGLEKILLAWSSTATTGILPGVVKDFGDSWVDGLAFGALIARFRPDLLSWSDYNLISEPLERLEFIFALIENHLGVQRLLDPEDFISTPDKKSLMMYIMCLYDALPHDAFPLEEKQTSLNSDSECSLIGSPFKTPIKISEEGLKYDVYCPIHEDMVEWLLDAEEKLNAMKKVSGDLPEIKQLFEEYKNYMEELNYNQGAVGEVIDLGSKLMDDPKLTPFQEKDVQVRVKVLSDKWEELRVLAMNRQSEIFELVMALQKDKMRQLREWMTLTEDRISRMGNIGSNLDEIKIQMSEQSSLQKDLENQQSTVNLISNFIIADVGEGKSETSGGENSEQELEDQVTALGERWIHLCVWIEERWSALKDAASLWTLFLEEKEVLNIWLDESMTTLKEVERSPTEDMKELMIQVKLIATIHEEVVSYQRRLSSLERTVDSLCLRYESNHAVSDDVGKTLELLQDRWEILTDILEAQKQRISSLGLTIENYFESPSKKSERRRREESKDSNRNGGITSASVISMASKSNGGGSKESSSSHHHLDEDSTPKKRKITGSKRILFETSYAKLVAWLHPRLEPSYEIAVDEDVSIESEVNKTFELGKDLIRGIISEDDFPPDYLGNIRAKIRELEALWKAFDTKRVYSALKSQFYSELNSLKKLLEASQSLLESCDDIECLRTGKEAFNKHSSTLDSIKRLSTDVTLCPGALQDPSSSVKSDLYSFCDKWALIESGFEAKEIELIKRSKLLLQQKKRSSVSTKEENNSNGNMKASLGFDSDPSKMDKLRVIYSEVEELEAWMNETEKSLALPEGSKLEDHGHRTLPTLVEDLKTLEKKLDLINSMGLELVAQASDESKARVFENYLKNIHERWSSIAEAVRTKHNSYVQHQDKSRQVDEDIGEILQFLKNIQRDYDNVLSSQSHSELTKPQELSQRTFKLLHFKDRVEKKRPFYEELIQNLDPTDPRISEITQKWDSLSSSILNRYSNLKTSSADYGEFKSLAAQESDWLERLEKKLRKSTLTTAADAEEISEALDDIENFIHNHSSGERLGRLEELSESLSQNGIKFDSVFAETKKLKARWEDLSKRAKERTSLLEGHIVEAQEWEYKILSVQEWLSERDMLLSSHLEHELNVDDLPEETQAILREFEDHENLLSEMDEQVEAYREEGKTEASSRLEDQLNLIHSRFRELAMKFELFQRQSASEYSLRLDRISRQLRDIASQLKLAELHSWDPSDVSGQLADATCVYNALSGIKPEVENVIKMGRVLVAENPSEEGNEELTPRIDALKNEFNQIGSQITDSRSVLEKALKLSEKLRVAMTNVETGLPFVPEGADFCETEDELYSYLKNKVSEMMKLKDDLRSILQIKSDLISLSLHGPIDDTFLVLQKRVDIIESRWKEVVLFLQKIHSQLQKSRDVSSIHLSSLDFEKEDVTLLKEGNSPLLAEFKSAFQEVSARIDCVEAKLFGKSSSTCGRRSDSDEEGSSNKSLDLGQEIESLRPEMSNLREMAIKLVVMFVGQKGDVEPEMRSLGQRWDEIVRAVEERLVQNKEFNMVEVEEIKTTISHLRIPTPTSISSSVNNNNTATNKKNNSSSLLLFSPDSEMDSEEIVTLPEDDDEMVSSCSSSSHIPSPIKKEEPKKISSLSIIPSSNKRIINSLPISSTSSAGADKVKVKVSINTLPTPQKAVTSPVTINSQVQFRHPEQTYLASNSSSSSLSTVTLTESKNGGMDEYDEESSLARDNEAIDKLLNDTNNHIEELKSKSSSYHHSSRSSFSNSAGLLEKESADFSASKKAMMSKMVKARGKITDLDREADLKLRLDLIEMESQMIEAEVATLISRGDTLVLMTHRNDVTKGEAIQKDVSELREAWADVKSLCERKKAHVSTLEKKLDDFKHSAEEIKTWLSSLKNKQDFRQSPSFPRKKLEVESLNNLGSTLKRQNVLGVNALNLSLINSKWDELLHGTSKSPSRINESISSKSPRSEPSDSQKEIVSILEKLIDAVCVISRQLNMHFLSSPKVYENLMGQRKSLEIVRSAIERIGPTVRKTESDVEGINGRDGGLSVEYYDKILVLGERLRKDWMELNSKYLERTAVWKSCSKKYEEFANELLKLKQWIETRQSERPSQSEILEKEKEITKISGVAKEIISQTSGDDALNIQRKVDDLLKNWNNLQEKCLPPLDKGSDATSQTKKPAISLDILYSPVNVSSLNQVSTALEKLDTIQKSFLDSSSDKDPDQIERLTPILSKKLSYLSEKKSRLEKFRDKILATDSWAEDMYRKLSDVTKQKMRGTRSSEIISRIRLAVIDKEYEVNRLLNEFMIIDREVSGGQKMDPELYKMVENFKIKWKKLTSESRRISTEGSSRESSPLVRRNNKSSDSSLKETLSYGSMMSPSSEAAMTSMTNESVASGTTYITSPLSEEVAPITANIEPSVSELDLWLKSLSSEISNSRAPIHDNESVKEIINRLTFLLHDLEIKRPFIDDLLQNSSSLTRDENKIKMKVRTLRDHWDSVKCLLLSRKTELMSMSAESDQFKRKSVEMKTGLKRIQERLAKLNRGSSERPSSFEALDLQIKSYLSLKKDLAKFYHQFNSFSSFCHRISTVYPKDDSSQIKAFEKSILSDYEKLESTVNENHNALQTSKSTLTNYDSSIHKFLAWLSEVESHVEGLEENEDLRKDPSKLSSKLTLVKKDIESKNSEFTSLLKTGESISNGLTAIESGMLNQRGGEMSSRLKTLNSKVETLNRASTLQEDSNNESLLLWVQKKRREIRSLTPALDLPGLGKQLEEHDAFEQRTLEEKSSKWKDIIEKTPEAKEWKALLTEIHDWREKLLERRKGLQMFQNDFEALTSSDEDELVKLTAVEETRSFWNESSFLEALEEVEGEKKQSPVVVVVSRAKSEEEDNNNDSTKEAQMKRIGEALGSLEEGLFSLKKQAERFNSHGQGLSESTKHQLIVLEERIINLRNQLPPHLTPLSSSSHLAKSKLISHVPEGQKVGGNEDLPPGWERGFTEDHIPYFLNHKEASTTWDHPVFSSLMNSLKEINSVQYSVYRLALKLRKIQQKLCLDLLDIEAALIGFNELGLGPDKHDCSLTVPEMSSLLTSLISAAQAENPEEVDVPLCSNLALNWILNVYDPGRTGSVRVFAFKIAVLIFTRGPLTDKYKAFFDLLSHPEDKDPYLDPSRVGLLIHDCLQIPKVFGEIASFGGSNVEPSVRSCFTMDQKTPLSTVNEEHFIKWLRLEPQCLVWLPVLHRLAWAELAKHNAKCNVCKMYPMVGFRYLCLKCFNFDLCHNCFFLGKTTKTHSLDHPMKEFCTSTGASVNLKNFTASVRNSFRTKKYFKKKYKQLCYLPVSSVLEGEDFVIPPLSSLSQTSTLESNKSNNVQNSHCVQLESDDDDDDDENENENDDDEVVHGINGHEVRSSNASKSSLKPNENGSSHNKDHHLEDEHSLISKYCQILFDQREPSGGGESLENSHPKSETNILDQIKAENRQCKRLEKRINILESHNRQLEGHVQRLRELFSNENNGGGSGTLNSKSITASDLTQSSTDIDTVEVLGYQRAPPPKIYWTDSGENEEDHFRLDSPDSLNLSQHETTVISD